MGKKVKVAAIQIQYPDGDVKQVSVEDARDLYQQLDELFGDKTVYVPGQPVVVERDRYPFRPMWTSPPPSICETPVEKATVWMCTDSSV